jgi:hypothetical protein
LNDKTWQVSDTVKSKPNAAGKTPNVLAAIDINIEPFEEAEDKPPQYFMKLPADIVLKNQWVEAEVLIEKDSSLLKTLTLNGSVVLRTDEKAIDKYHVQKSVVFVRNNPYVTNWNDSYTEAPRLTKKGERRGKIKVALVAIPTTFFASYLAYRQGWIK